ncbi:MAG: outer membrane protein assembly factor BamA [Proteobacteria bacterium]|nr:outer membrane protein assembly factor BamA [Pseudomonadota bacterium]
MSVLGVPAAFGQLPSAAPDQAGPPDAAAPPGRSSPPAAPLPAEAQRAGAARTRNAAPVATMPIGRGATPAAGTIQSIQVTGNQRIETGTILSYMLVSPGDPFDADRLDRSLKTLYATGLFQDVSLQRQGDVLVVKVVENPIINRVAFEGNHKLNDDQLRAVVQLRARGVYTPAAAEQDRQRMLELYAKRGRYDTRIDPQIIRLEQNRVDVVYEITEGPATLTSRIAFVGNKAFSESRLLDVINSRESAWWRLLSTSDEYDPEKVNYDKELLRRFYLKEGYADFQVKDATAELSPDRKSFFLTFTIFEGERYKVGKVSIDSRLPKVPSDSLTDALGFQAGDWYDGDLVGRTTDDITTEVRNRGYAFVQVTPRITRNQEKHTVDIVFEVGEGPRVYVERIDISGNTRTEDKVIRREFRLAEGDPFNEDAVRLSRQRLTDLGFFSNVTVQPTPGSAPDRTILNTQVQEKATGELSFGGGYSTDVGFLLDVGLRERNLVGTGISAGINGVLAQRQSSINLNVTDPYFLDRNLVASTNAFLVQTNNISVSQYQEKRAGFTVGMGYAFNEHLRQNWLYTLVGRTVYDVQPGASFYILDQQGYTVLSGLGQVFTIDYRDSAIAPHTGFVVRGGADYAGIGGNANFFRVRADGTYYLPLDRFTGNSDWGFAISGSAGYLFNLGQQEQIIDRFFMGGDNLRGFEAGGAGPHDPVSGDSLGGRLLVTQSTELRFPLPVSKDLGLSGRAFVDVGRLIDANFESNYCPTAPGGVCPPIFASPAFRVGAGFGVSWQTPFGLINVDLTPFVVKQAHDQTQIFRFGFGTRF